MTKATNLKTIFLKSPWKIDVETCVTLGYFLHFFNLFLSFFSTLPRTQTKKVIDLIFFQRVGLEKLGYEHAFQPYSYSLRPFYKGGA